MKFFHLSDLHIGLKLMNHDMREDQEYILSEVIEVAGREKPDAIVIAGDIYDKAVPSAEAVEVFDRFLVGLTEAVAGCGYYDDQRKPRQCSESQLFPKSPFRAEHLYGGTAAAYRVRIYRKSNTE